MGARMEKTRQSLDRMLDWLDSDDENVAAALAEVEEWEARLTTADEDWKTAEDRLDKALADVRYQFNRAEAAEAKSKELEERLHIAQVRYG